MTARARRLLAGMDEPVPDPWQMAADACRGELERREEIRRLIRSLSPSAWAIILFLDGQDGRAFMEQLPAGVPDGLDVRGGLVELLEQELVELRYARNERGDVAECVVALRVDGELPEPD